MNSAIQHACAVMNDFGAPWGIAGGWALDIFLGVESRPHADVDVSIVAGSPTPSEETRRGNRKTARLPLLVYLLQRELRARSRVPY
jgi:hypothetical protein